MRTQRVVLLATAASLGLACAGHPPPTDNMASAVAAVRGAQVAVAQAGQVPEAALHLKLAEEQVAQAREMMNRGDNERANYMTLRAFNDAELSLALAREHEARAAADEAAKRGVPSATTEPTEPNAAQPNAPEPGAREPTAPQPDVEPNATRPNAEPGEAVPGSSDPHARPAPSPQR